MMCEKHIFCKSWLDYMKTVKVGAIQLILVLPMSVPVLFHILSVSWEVKSIHSEFGPCMSLVYVLQVHRDITQIQLTFV